MIKIIIRLALFVSIIFTTQARAQENPDQLYKQGKFAEAEKAYARSDMDHPKDIRYRYNRGCAAYQNSDYDGATAAFASVLRRSEDSEVRFKTAYNLGNTAYKRGDFRSAVSFYKQAILYNSSNEDARHNLELALRALEKQKKEKKDHEEKKGDNGDKPEKSMEQSTPDKHDEKEHSKKENSQDKDLKSDNTKTESGEKKESDKKKVEKSPEDLSGELKPSQEMQEQPKDDQITDQAAAMIDKKKAEALLDNIKEDRSRFLRFQVPKEKEHGVPSGKDW